MKHIDLTGKTFGKLKVLHQLPSIKNARRWLCRCNCGREVDIRTGCLTKPNGTRSCYTCSNKIAPGLAAKNIVFGTYKKCAEKRNLKFKLSFEEFIILGEQNCRYCNVLPGISVTAIRAKNQPLNGDWLHNGIDRWDNDAGYTTENSVACCSICNFMKGKLSGEEFLKQVEKIYINNLTKGEQKCEQQ